MQQQHTQNNTQKHAFLAYKFIAAYNAYTLQINAAGIHFALQNFTQKRLLS